MPEGRRHPSRPARPPADTPPRQRIPLPPLHRNRPSGGQPAEPEAAEFLGTPPPAEAARSEPRRTGSSGAAVLDALVDEIERDLDRENGRHDPAAPASPYRITLACSSLIRHPSHNPGHSRAPAGPRGR